MKNLITRVALLATVILLTVTFLFAQTYQWHKQFTGNLPNSSLGNDVAVDASGNVYVVGKFQGTIDFGQTSLLSTGSDFFYAKYNANGVLQWAKQIGGVNADLAGTAVSLYSSGGTVFLYITGYFSSTNGQIITIDFNPGLPGGDLMMNDLQGDAFVAKYYASNGAYVWAKRINNTIANSFYKQKIATDGSGNAYVIADVDSNNQGTLRKFDANGNAVWTKTTTGVMRDVACRGSYVYVGGASLGNNGNSVAWFNTSNGALVSSAGSGDFMRVCLDAGTGIYVFGDNNPNAFVEKFSTNGSLIWSTTINLLFSNYDYHDISIGGPNQSVVILAGWFAGTANFGNGFTLTAEGSNNNLFAARYNASNGSCTWVKGNPVSSVGGGGGWNTTAVASNAQFFYILSYVNNATIDIDYCTTTVNLNATNANNGYVTKYMIESGTSSIVINGSSLVCTAGSYYELGNTTTGSTFNWSVSPANFFVTGSGTGSTANLVATPQANGNATLTFTGTTGCGITLLPITKSLWVGPAQTTTDMSYNLLTNVPSEICVTPSSVGDFYTYIHPFSTTYFEWETDAGTLATANPNYTFNPNLTTVNQVNFPNTVGTYPQRTIQVRSVNACGASAWNTRYFNLTVANECGGGMGLSVYPNPSSEYAEVTLEGADPSQEKLDFEYLLELFDDVGNKKTSLVTTNRTSLIDLKSFQRGTYYVKAKLKDKILSQRLFIE